MPSTNIPGSTKKMHEQLAINSNPDHPNNPDRDELSVAGPRPDSEELPAGAPELARRNAYINNRPSANAAEASQQSYSASPRNR